jgi:hypothetical protein
MPQLAHRALDLQGTVAAVLIVAAVPSVALIVGGDGISISGKLIKAIETRELVLGADSAYPPRAL